MLPLNSRVYNPSLKFCVKTFKCGYKTKPDCSKGGSINNVKEIGEIGSTNLLENFSIGTCIVKEGVKDVYYFTAFAAAVAVAGALLFYVFRDLFSSKSPTSVYGRALKIVQANSQVEDALGTPIKGYGEETRRGRRRDVSHVEYIKDGVNYMRVKFYVQGPQGKGTVRLEVKENESSQFEYRYLLVELDTYPMKSIVLIDER